MSKTATLLVTEADEASAVLADVDDGPVHALSSNPGLSAGEAIAATIDPDPPLEVTWSIAAIDDRWRVSIEAVSEAPTAADRDVAADLDPGEIARPDPGDSEARHVLAVPPERTEAAVDDVRTDEGTRRRAARLGASRVEIRGEAGVVSVRYL